MSDSTKLTRREALARGGALAAGAALLPSEIVARLVELAPQEAVVPWINAPTGRGRNNTLDWQTVTSWTTPTGDMFRIGHYGEPEIDARMWRLTVDGLVARPRAFTLDDLRARPRREMTFALECGGNRGFPTFVGAVHNARWAGTPLAPILEEAGVLEDGIEVVFFGADRGDEEVRGSTVRQAFARSMSVSDAMDANLLLCYEVNGEPLPIGHGFPVRLVAPGWYGIANVKWLQRIELRSTRYMGRFMARDYVTLREEEIDGEEIWVETSVGRARINSIPAKVTRDATRHRIHGAAWGADIARVEVKIDDGPWRPAVLGEGQGDAFTWTFWHLDWDRPGSGAHTVTSRAIDVDGNIQPAADDPYLAAKATYWESNGQVTREIHIA